MKTILIWFCGTGTPKEDMASIFEGQTYDKKIIVSGVGTDETSQNVRTLENGYFPNNFNWLFTTRDIVLGYRERHQLSSAEEGMMQIYSELTDATPDNSVHLMIGAHSRGAADGMIGLLTSLYASCMIPGSTPNEDILFKKINKISLLAVDPVNGAEVHDTKVGMFFDTNDLMGFNDLPKDQQSIHHLLETIETRSDKKGLFDVVLYTARFDARDEFLLDKHWLKFLNDIQKGEGFKGNFKYYVGGFRHSAMVYESSELTGLYDRGYTPIALLRQILDDIKLNTNDADLIYKNMATKEIMLINDLVSEENELLEANTHTKSYSWAEVLTSYGESLKTIAQKYKDDGNPMINNRYLKHYLN